MRILSFDGGGLRGVLPLTILDRLEKEKNIKSDANFYAGTSTGGIIALALAAGYTPGQVLEFYQTFGPEIFSGNTFRRIFSLAKYKNENLKRALESQFGSLRLKDLERKVMIPAFHLDNMGNPRTWKAKFFHNFYKRGEDNNELCVDVAMRTAAAPVFFPAYQGYIDGGLVANNPAMSAVAQCIRHEIDDSEIVMISMGTGLNPTYLSGLDLDWGVLRWIKYLVTMTMEGSVGVDDYQSKMILQERMLRVDPDLGRPIALDDPGSIEELIRIGYQYDLSVLTTWALNYWHTFDNTNRWFAN